MQSITSKQLTVSLFFSSASSEEDSLNRPCGIRKENSLSLSNQINTNINRKKNNKK